MGEAFHCIGVDVGGSHLSACLVDCMAAQPLESTERRSKVDSHAPADDVLRQWAGPIRGVLEKAPPRTVRGIGIAMPGPFDYEAGVSLMRGLNKYDALHGMNVAEELRARLGLPAGMPVLFENDAGCFALGEAAAAGEEARVIGVTLGTGFGSGFVAGGCLQKGGPGVPPGGFLYEQPWEGGLAEDAFSGRGVRALHHQRTGQDYTSAALLARDAAHDPAARETWQHYGEQLGRFLGQWAEAFRADLIVLGGSMTGAWNLFGPPLEDALSKARPGCIARPSPSPERSAMVGAARLVLQRHGVRADG